MPRSRPAAASSPTAPVTLEARDPARASMPTTPPPAMSAAGAAMAVMGQPAAGRRLRFGGSTYGSVTAPVDRGSGGGNYSPSAPGGAGGGAIRMNVTGALLVNGRISANGGAGIGQGTGGGSGGSVWLTAGTLAGAGTISANGGAGNELGGGGGGGRVASPVWRECLRRDRLCLRRRRLRLGRGRDDLHQGQQPEPWARCWWITAAITARTPR